MSSCRPVAVLVQLIISASTDHVPAADHNADGRGDLLWRHTPGHPAIWFMNGAQTVGGGGFTTVDPNWSIVGVGDFNGDDRADILWRRLSGQLVVSLMNGLQPTSSEVLGDPTRQIARLSEQVTTTATVTPISCGGTAPVKSPSGSWMDSRAGGRRHDVGHDVDADRSGSAARFMGRLVIRSRTHVDSGGETTADCQSN
jgi:hypothetical protein